MPNTTQSVTWDELLDSIATGATHPDDTNALAYYREQCDIRRQLLNDYASQFGPLTADYACKNTSAEWDWVMQPWPWEACQKGGSSECGIMKKDCSFR